MRPAKSLGTLLSADECAADGSEGMCLRQPSGGMSGMSYLALLLNDPVCFFHINAHEPVTCGETQFLKLNSLGVPKIKQAASVSSPPAGPLHPRRLLAADLRDVNSEQRGKK